MTKAGLYVETFVGAGRYQHKVYGIGNYTASRDIPNDIEEMQKRLNERLWEHMPEGSGLVRSRIDYILPKKPNLISRITGYISRRNQNPNV